MRYSEGRHMYIMRLENTYTKLTLSFHLQYKDLKRFFLSAFYHTGESHLFYNMLSLLWKGIHLESSMGSVEFASMVATLLGLSQGITVIMAKLLLLLFDYETAYYRQYAVGFSGVLFGMKMVLNSQSDDFTYVHGLIVPTRFAAWAELFLIQLFVPGVSFLGHLGGIFAGMLYLWMKGRQSGPDPLTSLIRHVVGLVGWPVRFIKNIFHARRNRISGRGRVGEGRFGPSVSGTWRCRACTYDNSDWNDVCEMCNTERSYVVSQQSNIVSLEELRRRRLERFST